MPDLPPEADEVRTLRVQPGDRLVVHVTDETFDQSTPDDLTQLREMVAAWAQLPVDAVIVMAGADLAVIRGEPDHADG